MEKNVKEILTVENNEKELSERSMEIDTKNQAKLMREINSAIKDTIRNKNLSYLSAPSIGYQRRIFAINFNDIEIKTFINPVIANAKGLHLAKEISNVIPGKTFIRPRNTELTVMYQRPTGQPETRQLKGLVADVFQQCMDDIDGILLSDIGLEIDENWDSLEEKERQEIIEYYLDSLDLREKELRKEIKSIALSILDNSSSDSISFLSSSAVSSMPFSLPSSLTFLENSKIGL